MRPEFFILAIGLSFVFETSYLLFIQYIQRIRFKKSARLANTFPFEITPKFNEKTSFINYVFLFGLAVSLFPFIYYLTQNVHSYSISLMILAVLLIVALAIIPFIGLDKLREHLILDVSALILLVSLYAMEALYAHHLYKLSNYNLELAAMIVAIVFAVIVLVLIINPKLFDLKNNVDEQGNPTRKKVIFLAVTEWLLYPLSILTLVPMLLLSI